jgi:glycosyltransferase XagB
MKLDPITQRFVERHPKDCSYITLSLPQKIFYLLCFALLLLLIFYRWDYFIFLATATMSFWYLAAVLFRTTAAVNSLRGRGVDKISLENLASIDESTLPMYTIFLPLYKEANIASKIIHNIEQLDYPADKLDVKLLLESDDQETQDAVKKCELPEYFEVIVVPDFQPKTKPRACNYGLEKAKGEYCVIYDAEDRPEPDQLKKAVVEFRNSPQELACVQACLNYYNARQNLLTRLFTIEYSTTFDVMMPGMETFNVPLPLGGTSNHFKTAVLQEIGGWDPFNVTEDCDLGIRIYKRGYRTCMINSTTWEEANSRPGNWLRQRSRWVKGFFQTHFTHMRHPFRTLKGLGLYGMLGFYMSVGASSLMMLVNVFYWFAVTAYAGLVVHAMNHGISFWQIVSGPHNFENYQGVEIFGLHLKAWPLFYYGPMESEFWSTLSIVFCFMSLILLFANLLFLGCHVLACLRRKYYHLLPYCLLMPFYWAFISLGAWKGFLQFFTNPFYWEKTVHGFDKGDDFSETPVTNEQSTTILETIKPTESEGLK